VTPPPYPVPRLTPMKGGYTTITVPLASDTNI
jgi:hypothetical protein